MDSNVVRIFDTTLRDGEQAPGFSLTSEQKLAMARQLQQLRVDVIEAGFPAASPDDFTAVQRIAREIEGPIIAGLARCVADDVDACARAVKDAARPRIHTFISTSDIHLEGQFRLSRQQAKERAVEMVSRAKSYVDDVEFSPMDATRSEWEYVYEVLEAVIAAGATTVNIADTCGYAQPEEFGRFIRSIRENVRGIERAVISVHCHNDLGLATANSLIAIQNGARQVECCINGIGERAGNAALEEVVMALKIRTDIYGVDVNVDTSQLVPASRMLSAFTNSPVQRNKAVVGDNAFAHESGIHQDGMLKDTRTYEIMEAAMVGYGSTKLVLGKHSGRHALKVRLAQLGHTLTQEELNETFLRFKELADRKKEITDEDLEEILVRTHAGAMRAISQVYR